MSISQKRQRAMPNLKLEKLAIILDTGSSVFKRAAKSPAKAGNALAFAGRLYFFSTALGDILHRAARNCQVKSPEHNARQMCNRVGLSVSAGNLQRV
jgi:hypothetical protein